jgi:hypothetical protein
VEVLKICGTIMMVVIMKFSFCLHEIQWLMIIVDEFILPKNVIPPLAKRFHNGVNFFVISRVLMNSILQCLTMIGHGVAVLSDDCAHNTTT